MNGIINKLGPALATYSSMTTMFDEVDEAYSKFKLLEFVSYHSIRSLSSAFNRSSHSDASIGAICSATRVAGASRDKLLRFRASIKLPIPLP